MAVETFGKQSTVLTAVEKGEETEEVIVGVHKADGEKLTFSGGTQGNAVIVSDPPTMILTASSNPLITRIFHVTFRIEASDWEFPKEGALRLMLGSANAGVQILRDTEKEARVRFYTELKAQKDLGSFELGLVKIPGTSALARESSEVPAPVWHDPTILWEPPMT